jgi:hypothetical protein
MGSHDHGRKRKAREKETAAPDAYFYHITHTLEPRTYDTKVRRVRDS